MDVIMKKQLGSDIFKVGEGLAFTAGQRLYTEVGALLDAFGRTRGSWMAAAGDRGVHKTLLSTDLSEYLPERSLPQAKQFYRTLILYLLKRLPFTLRLVFAPLSFREEYLSRVMKRKLELKRFEEHEGTFSEFCLLTKICG